MREFNHFSLTLITMTPAIDIDGVLANFQQHFINKAHEIGYDGFPKHWTQWEDWHIPEMQDEFNTVFEAIENDSNWWLDIPPYDDAHLTCAPAMYLTARPIASMYSKVWLNKCGFPDAPVKTVETSSQKPGVMEKHGIDVLLDDRPKTFHLINNSDKDTTCYLLDRPYNRHIDNRRLRVHEVYQFQKRME